MAAFPKYTYKRITTGSNLIKNGPGVLAALVLNKVTAGTVTITDGANTIGIIATATPVGTCYIYGGCGGIMFGQQLQIVCSGTEDITVVYE